MGSNYDRDYAFRLLPKSDPIVDINYIRDEQNAIENEFDCSSDTGSDNIDD